MKERHNEEYHEATDVSGSSGYQFEDSGDVLSSEYGDFEKNDEAIVASRLCQARTALREKVGAGTRIVREAPGRVGEAARGTVEQINPRERAEQAGEAVRSAVKKGTDAAKAAPPYVEARLEWSRKRRLEVEERNRNRNVFQRAMGTVIGKIVVSGIEMIPSPWFYGPGDLLTAANAITGKNLMTGEHLDSVERVIHGVAAAIPVVPATPIVEAARYIRRGVEDVAHARREQSVKDLHGGMQDIQRGVNGFREIINDVRSGNNSSGK